MLLIILTPRPRYALKPEHTGEWGEETINNALIPFLYVMGHLYPCNKMIQCIGVTAANRLFYYISHYMSLWFYRVIVISAVLLGRDMWMSKFSRLHGSLKFSESPFCYRVLSSKVDRFFFFSLNLSK